MAGRLLIVDGVATNRIMLKVKFAAACYDTLQAADATTALRLARSARPDLIVLHIGLPGGTGPALLRRLRAVPRCRSIPIIALGAPADAAARTAALAAGAAEVLEHPVDEALLMARVRSLLRQRKAAQDLMQAGGDGADGAFAAAGLAEPGPPFERPGTVAIVGPDIAVATVLRDAVAPLLPDRFTLLSREAALSSAGAGAAPDVYVITADLRGAGDGLRLMSELRSRAGSRDAAICIALPPADREAAAMALDLGADDLLPTTAAPCEQALRIRRQIDRKQTADAQRARVERQLRMAVKDPLTGLHNRHYALPELGRIAERSWRTGRPFAVLLLDLDRFKTVNDTHGHAAGDKVLTEVAARLRREVRGIDLVARIGGEEFLIVLPDTDLPAARRVAERLCGALPAAPVPLPDGIGLKVTASIGLASAHPPTGPAPRRNGCDARSGGTPDVMVLLERADRALMAAKADGRNRVTIAPRVAA